MQRRQFLSGVLAGTGLAGIGSASAGTAEPLSARGDSVSEIEILTDEYNVSHVYADDLYSLGFGNGYVQTRDRLFLMDVLRHVSLGDSASVFGPGSLASDYQVKRNLYSEEQIEEQFENASPFVRKLIRGFADGVNRKMTEMAANGNLPAEFGVLGHPPEPWEPEHSVAITNWYLGLFGVWGGAELRNARTLSRLMDVFDSETEAYETYEDLNWLELPDEHYTSIPDDEKTVDYGQDVPAYGDVPDRQLELARAASGAEPWGIDESVTIPDDVTMGLRNSQGVVEGFKWGSNALVVGGELTETGRPMLGGGPQAGMLKPALIHEVGLHGAGFDVTGISRIGVPTPSVGRTPNFAWTTTSGFADQVDTIAVELHPDDRHRYRWNDEWHEMETRTVTHVASPVPPALGGDAEAKVVEQEVARIKENGDELPVIAWNEAENVAWAQRVTSRFQELEAAFMWAKVGQQDTFEEFKEQISEFPFTFNYNFAGRENIARIHAGKAPVRQEGFDHRLPIPGDDQEWLGMRVGTGLGANVSNPDQGYLVNWNNAPIDGWRVSDTEQRWGPIHRVDVLDEVVREQLDVPGNAPPTAAKNRLSLDDIHEIIAQASSRDAVARGTAPAMIEAARRSGDPQLQAMGEELEDWARSRYAWQDDNDDDIYDHAGHAIWDETRRELQSLVFEDELGELVPTLQFEPSPGGHAADHGSTTTEGTLVDALEGRTNHDWFDDVTKVERTTKEEVLETTLRRAAETLSEQFGTDDPSLWYTEEHTTVFTPIGVQSADEIDMINRASYNQVIAFGEGLSGSFSVLPPGNSGHVSTEEFARAQAGGGEPDRLTDQLADYVQHDPKPHPVTREQVEAVTTRQETLLVSSLPADRR
jgi:penicillin amidase